jgi:antitoxin MazE
MKTQVGKWGNSLAVRIPGTYAKELRLPEGVELEVTRVDGGLLLRPRFDLASQAAPLYW